MRGRGRKSGSGDRVIGRASWMDADNRGKRAGRGKGRKAEAGIWWEDWRMGLGIWWYGGWDTRGRVGDCGTEESHGQSGGEEATGYFAVGYG